MVSPHGGTGAAARGQFHHPHRTEHGCGTAPPHQGRVRHLPRVRRPGARFLAPAMRRVRARHAAHIQPQAPGVLPIVRRAADVADRGAPGRRCESARAGAAMGAVSADPTAFTAAAQPELVTSRARACWSRRWARPIWLTPTPMATKRARCGILNDVTHQVPKQAGTAMGTATWWCRRRTANCCSRHRRARAAQRWWPASPASTSSASSTA